MKLSEFNRQVANLSEQHGDRELYVNGEPWSGTIDVLNNADFVNITIDNSTETHQVGDAGSSAISA